MRFERAVTVVYNLYLEGVLTVNKNELISSIASETGLTKTDSAKAVDAFVNSISSALKSGDEVRLVGFGTFAFTVALPLPAAILVTASRLTFRP